MARLFVGASVAVKELYFHQNPSLASVFCFFRAWPY